MMRDLKVTKDLIDLRDLKKVFKNLTVKYKSIGLDYEVFLNFLY